MNVKVLDALREKIYRQLEELGIIEKFKKGESWIKIQRPQMEDLNIERLIEDGDRIIMSIGFFYEQNGDLVPDPELVLVVRKDLKKAAVSSFQNNLTYQEAKDEREEADLSLFTVEFLETLINMGYGEDIRNTQSPSL